MKTINAGKTHPKLWVENGIHWVMGSNKWPRFSDPKKSGILKTNVVITTPLNTRGEASRFGTTFSKINTMVIG